MRKKYLIGNWKMNARLEDAKHLLQGISFSQNVETIVAPSFLYILELHQINVDHKVSLAAQNMHYEESGAFSGEISPSMLKEVGTEYVILGHSERRHIFGEDNQLINKKIKSALNMDLKVVLCVGETKDMYQKKMSQSYIQTQINESLKDITSLNSVIIAYEPVWAVGTGVLPTTSEIQEMHKYIRVQIAKLYGQEYSQKISILYGGSIDTQNAEEIFQLAEVDGFILGSASLNAQSFNHILKIIEDN